MQLTTTFSETLIQKLSETKVEITFSDKNISGFPCFNPLTGVIEIITTEIKEYKTPDGKGSGFLETGYVPFKVTINSTFHTEENDMFKRNSKYTLFINDLTQSVLSEVDTNVNLRIGKWEILDYFTLLKLKLSEIRNGFHEIPSNCPETNCKPVLINKQAKITTDDNILFNCPDNSEWINYVLTFYWEDQIRSIDTILEYIRRREEIIEKTDDYVRVINEIPTFNGTIMWEASDTDLLELITALVESGSVQNSTKSITRKEAIDFFSEIFGLEIKDAESKLSRATERKKDLSPFLTKLKYHFEQYVQKKDTRSENLRK